MLISVPHLTQLCNDLDREMKEIIITMKLVLIDQKNELAFDTLGQKIKRAGTMSTKLIRIQGDVISVYYLEEARDDPSVLEEKMDMPNTLEIPVEEEQKPKPTTVRHFFQENSWKVLGIGEN